MKVEVNITKTKLFLIIGTIFVIGGLIFAFALPAGQVPNPGHDINNIGAPAGCVNGQALLWNGNAWYCDNVVTQVVAGDNVVVTPTEGNGVVTIVASSPSGGLSQYDKNATCTGVQDPTYGIYWINCQADCNSGDYAISGKLGKPTGSNFVGSSSKPANGNIGWVIKGYCTPTGYNCKATTIVSCISS